MTVQNELDVWLRSTKADFLGAVSKTQCQGWTVVTGNEAGGEHGAAARR